MEEDRLSFLHEITVPNGFLGNEWMPRDFSGNLITTERDYALASIRFRILFLAVRTRLLRTYTVGESAGCT